MTAGDYMPGRGYGVQPAPMNAPRAVELGVGVQPGTPNIIRARQVIVFGPNDGLFVYTGTPRAGNPPVASIVAPGVTADPYGNTVASILEVQQSGLQTVLTAASLTMAKLSGALNPPQIILGDNTAPAGTPSQTFVRSSGIISPLVIAVQPGTSSTAEAWHPLTLQGGFTNVAGFAPASYRLNALGNVEMAGQITGTISGSTLFGALPAGYYSATYARNYAANVDSAAAGLIASETPHIACDTAGNLRITGLNNGTANIDLDGTFMLSAG